MKGNTVCSFKFVVVVERQCSSFVRIVTRILKEEVVVPLPGEQCENGKGFMTARMLITTR